MPRREEEIFKTIKEFAKRLPKFSDGRIRQEKLRINLYIWMDENRIDPGYFIIKYNRHHDKLCELFNLDPTKMKYYKR